MPRFRPLPAPRADDPFERLKAELRKVLELEIGRGCDNKATAGGLDVFLQRWRAKAKPLLKDNPTRRRLDEIYGGRTHYASLPVPERRRWLSGLVERLQRRTATTRSPRPVLSQAGATPRSTGEAPAKARGSAQRRSAPTPHGVGAPLTVTLDSPITRLHGISTVLAEKFRKLGVENIHDLLYHFPRRYNDFGNLRTISELQPGAEDQTIVANVWQASEKRLGVRRGSEAVVGDTTGNLRVVWFNQPWVARSLRPGVEVVLSGRVSSFRGRLVMENPEWELASEELIHAGRLVPVYPLTEGIYPRVMRKLMKNAVDGWAGLVLDPLPAALRRRVGLADLTTALQQIHFPDDWGQQQQAHKRLAFDELFTIQLTMLTRKRQWQESQPGHPLLTNPEWLAAFRYQLPFSLTRAQERSLDEILADLAKPKPMSRLLQGEVGSGKTVVATIALLVAMANGFQGALMAPTEILAEQHYRTITSLLEDPRQSIPEGFIRPPIPFAGRLPRVVLLQGSMTASEKRQVHNAIARGEVDIVVGTHAIIQEGVSFKHLGLAVIDEQHRFGVLQRSALRQKGFNPHVLVMTATPIPRTLALTLYGDLDLSIIDEMPPGRQEIKTRWLPPEKRHTAYNFIREQIKQGRQAFIICPLVEESAKIEAKAAVAEYERLQKEVFPDLKLGLLHGRMRADEKDAAMRRFKEGESQILVSTSVVEVGIDVPNATVMLIEGADRFGLSQLHQFRGRVGRSAHESYCILLAESPSEEGAQRLQALERTQNGLELAEEDLRLRGPGEFFGTRQSGLPELKLADVTDLPWLELTRREADTLLAEDPDLSQTPHALLREKINAFLAQGGEEVS